MTLGVWLCASQNIYLAEGIKIGRKTEIETWEIEVNERWGEKKVFALTLHL